MTQFHLDRRRFLAGTDDVAATAASRDLQACHMTVDSLQG